jgi:hypothetical protein
MIPLLSRSWSKTIEKKLHVLPPRHIFFSDSISNFYHIPISLTPQCNFTISSPHFSVPGPQEAIMEDLKEMMQMCSKEILEKAIGSVCASLEEGEEVRDEGRRARA